MRTPTGLLTACLLGTATLAFAGQQAPGTGTPSPSAPPAAAAPQGETTTRDALRQERAVIKTDIQKLKTDRAAGNRDAVRQDRQQLKQDRQKFRSDARASGLRRKHRT